MSAETTEQRNDRGRELSRDMGATSADWDYHAQARARLSNSQRAAFDLEFIKARKEAGVRPAVDMALARMRAKLMQRLGTPTWRAG